MNIFKRITIFNKQLFSKHIRFVSTESRNNSKAHFVLLAIPAAAFGLGTWQVKRLEWKKGLIRDLERRTQRPPVPLPADILDPGKMKELDYSPVFAEGKFDHSKEIYIGPRSLTRTGPNTGGGLIGPASKSGYQVITPFVLKSGERILINRGWVSRDRKDPSTRPEGQITDTVKISGLIRVSEQRPQFTPKIQEGSTNWHYRDIDQFTKELDSLPIFIDADSRSSVNGGPIGGQTLLHIRNEHMQYIITWYSLGIATSFMFYKYNKNPAAMFKGGPSSTNF